MKVFYIFTLLFLCVNAVLRKRVSDDRITQAIEDFLGEGNIAEPGNIYWSITHYAANDIVEAGKITTYGHHWIVAAPLTEKGGVFDGTALLKLHLQYEELFTNVGNIFTKYTVTKTYGKELSSDVKIISSGETIEPTNIFEMAEELGTVEEESFKDGAIYDHFNVNRNCQGFSACQFDKVYQRFLKQAGGCSN
jgi:hypothetical protein